MENHIDTIISQLSHIESTAVRIMESADYQKKELASEMEEQTKQYNEELAEDTKRRLDEIKRTLDEQKSSELSRLEQETAQALQELEHNYQMHHTAWAKEILHSITGA